MSNRMLDDIAGVDLQFICSAAAGCDSASFCAVGTPHPDQTEQERCYDHKPYLEGGLMVWDEAIKEKGDRCNG